MTRESDKLKIIYILGTGHSGSTLLELILSTAPGTFSVGGFRYLDRYVAGSHGIVRDDSGCLAEESPMWQEMAKESGDYIIEKPKEPVLSLANRIHILLTGVPSKVPERYRNEKLYSTVRKNAEKILDQPVSTIIDSSKTLARLIEIKESTDFDIFVIHLIRDVRGVANSNRKRGMYILTSAKYWLTDNLYAQSYLRRSIAPEKQMRIHYEDFVADPERYIGYINERTGLHIDAKALVANINNQVSYRFAGNGMRNKRFSGIQKDIKWENDLPLFYRVILVPLQLMFK